MAVLKSILIAAALLAIPIGVVAAFAFSLTLLGGYAFLVAMVLAVLAILAYDIYDHNHFNVKGRWYL